MNKYKGDYIRRKILAIFLMTAMFFGGIAPLGLGGVYADDPEPMVIQITGNTVNATYDGTAKKAEGYVATSNKPDLFDESKVKYAGDASVTATEAGTYDMGLVAEKFSYDENYQGEVTFNVTDGRLTITTPRPAAPARLDVTSGYERFYLSWPPVSSNAGKDKKVYYEIRRIDGNKEVVVDNGLTATSYRIKFDPYPGDKNGKGSSGVAKKTAYAVYSYIIDPSTNQRLYSASGIKRTNLSVIHPMYIVVQAKRSANMYASKSSKKSVGKIKKGTKYVAIGGSRLDGKNKRVIIKVGGKLRYIKSEDVKIQKMWYYSKSTFSRKAVEDFINDCYLNSNPVKGPKRLIWVNTYNQHVYLFAWNSNTKRWVIDSRYRNGMLCNTGKELTPYGVFKVSTKWERKKSTGTMWWCILGGTGVGIHEKLGEALGKPASGGCIRIPDRIAKEFYKNLIKKKTTVFVY